ncbi:unnamed protein product, partial [marine sediment metagenome]
LGKRHNNIVNKILRSDRNIIVCFRTKTAYEVERDEKTGKSIPKKIGTKPITRDDMDYRMTIVFTLLSSNIAEQTKDRTGLYIGIQKKLDEADGKKIKDYLNDGETYTPETPQPEAPAATTEPNAEASIASQKADAPAPDFIDQLGPQPGSEEFLQASSKLAGDFISKSIGIQEKAEMRTWWTEVTAKKLSITTDDYKALTLQRDAIVANKNWKPKNANAKSTKVEK